MAKIKTDNPLDTEILKYKSELLQIQTKAYAFMTNFKQLPIKDRAKILLEISRVIQGIEAFINKSKTLQLTNAGTRFALENFKSSYLTFLGRWRKFERTFEEVS